jgi:hypothetical protein
MFFFHSYASLPNGISQWIQRPSGSIWGATVGIHQSKTLLGTIEVTFFFVLQPVLDEPMENG